MSDLSRASSRSNKRGSRFYSRSREDTSESRAKNFREKLQLVETNSTITSKMSASTSDENVKMSNDVFTDLKRIQVSGPNMDQLESMISSFKKSGLVDWINHNIAFAGFDAVNMRASIEKKVNMDGIAQGVLIGLVRGNNIDRIKTTMSSADAQKEFSSLISKLKLKARVGGDYKAVTLSRMIACFPELASSFMHNFPEMPMAVTLDEMKEIHAEYPPIARHQVLASCLTDELSSEDIKAALDVILTFYMKVSEKINTKNEEWKKMNKDQKIKNSIGYLSNALASRVLDPKFKKSFCLKFSIMSDSGSLTAQWRAVSKVCATYLRKNYGHCHADED